MLSSCLCDTVQAMSKGRADGTRDLLLRGLPAELGDKLKVASALHGQSMRAYIQTVLEDRVRELERKGMKLSLAKGREG